jgi:hypothetical protein
VSITTTADLEARSLRDAATHCWHWQGAKATDGTPRIWTFDHERGEKRCMSGPKAVWNIAHQAAPRAGWLVFRRCVTSDCVNPSHMAQASNKAEIGVHIARRGSRKGKFAEQARANARKASAAAGIVYTPPEIVRAIRAAGPEQTSLALAAIHGLAHQTVSRIRRGDSHRGVA